MPKVLVSQNVSWYCMHVCDTGPTQKPQYNAVGTPKKFFGVTEFGFSKKNEVCCTFLLLWKLGIYSQRWQTVWSGFVCNPRLGILS